VSPYLSGSLRSIALSLPKICPVRSLTRRAVPRLTKVGQKHLITASTHTRLHTVSSLSSSGSRHVADQNGSSSDGAGLTSLPPSRWSHQTCHCSRVTLPLLPQGAHLPAQENPSPSSLHSPVPAQRGHCLAQSSDGFGLIFRTTTLSWVRAAASQSWIRSFDGSTGVSRTFSSTGGATFFIDR
jgi:hypothetical protein